MKDDSKTIIQFSSGRGPSCRSAGSKELSVGREQLNGQQWSGVSQTVVAWVGSYSTWKGELKWRVGLTQDRSERLWVSAVDCSVSSRLVHLARQTYSRGQHHTGLRSYSKSLLFSSGEKTWTWRYGQMPKDSREEHKCIREWTKDVQTSYSFGAKGAATKVLVQTLRLYLC